MAEIQTYPPGTPSPGDGVVYVEDPTGAAALKLADPTSFGGGTLPGELRTFDGSTFTDTTTVGGTWTNGAEFVQTDTAATAHHLALASDIVYTPFQVTFECDIKFPTSGYSGISTLKDGAFYINSPCIAFAENNMYTIAAGASLINTYTIAAAADTWHRLRIVTDGSAWWAIYLNRNLVTNVGWGTNVDANNFALYSQSAVTHFRDITLWIR